jgi:acetyl-CoA carboxylase biotin carboxylase subunit
MFKKVLVANRGEIAVRVIRALKELDIRSVAVYSEADRDSLHVKMADEAICIGPAPSQKSYLSIPAIISAAEITGAEAIHPGYGFLSENELFAEICEAHGIKFIGPSGDLMKLMANKSQAKKVMSDLGLPVIPEFQQKGESLESFVRDIPDDEFPVLIKAAYGGGGKGIRLARNREELLDLAKTASAEAEAAFGSGEIYVEKFFEKPRHIEFQIIADSYGNVAVFNERDCSIQRRNQKIIEETPCVELPSALREEIKEKIRSAIKKMGYENAGTLEFLYDGNELYFMEMNTRLQVEHPITEETYDVDLVKTQVLVAAGEKLPTEVMESSQEGHAMEFRINAEDPDRNFMASPGMIESVHFPGGPGIRVDSHLYSGYRVPHHYDSLIAKLIVRAKNRDECLRRARRALEEIEIRGIKTNVEFLLEVIQTDAFRNQKYYTRFIEEEFMVIKNA